MEEFSLKDLVVPLRIHWRLIGGVACAVGALAVIYTYFFVPTAWETQTSIVFEDTSGGAASILSQFTMGAGIGPSSGSRGEFLEVLLKSRSVRGRVVDKLNLMDRFGTESRHEAMNMLGERYSANLPVPQVLVLNATWKGRPRASLRDAQSDASEMVAKVAEELIESLQQEVSHNDYTEAAQRRKMLEEQLQRATRELTEAEDELVRFATGEGLISVSQQGEAVVDQLETLQSREAELQASLDGALAREEAARAKLSDEERMTVSGLTESRDPAIDRLRQRIMDLEQQITEQKEVQGKSEQHPDVASLLSELESARGQLADAVESQMQLNSRNMAVNPNYSTLAAEVLTNSQRVHEIRASIDEVRNRKREILSQLEQFPAKSRTYERLRREVEMRGEAVARLTESYDLARLSEASSTTTFSIIDAPLVPEKASGPSLKKTLALAFLASFVITSLFVYLRHGRQHEAISEASNETNTTA